MIDQHNGYGGEKLARKSYDLNQTMQFNRSSLRASLAMKEKIAKIEDYQTELKKTVAKY